MVDTSSQSVEYEPKLGRHQLALPGPSRKRPVRPHHDAGVRLSPSTLQFDADDDDRVPTPSMDNIPSIRGDSDDENYLSSRIAALPLPGLESGDVSSRPPSQLSWRRKNAPPALRTSPKTPVSVIEDTPLRHHKHTKQVRRGRSKSRAPTGPEPEPPRRLFDHRFRPVESASPAALEAIYTSIRLRRSELKRLNAEIGELQSVTMAEISDGRTARGFLLVGKGVSLLSGVEPILGRTKDDVCWDCLLGRAPENGKLPGRISLFLRGLCVIVCELFASLLSSFTVLLAY